MHPMMSILKGTAMKDKKKRAAGAPSTGTYPSEFVSGGITFQLGVGSNQVGSRAAPSPNLHASVLYRDGLILSSGTPVAFLQLTNVAGSNVHSQGSPDFTIADYVATTLRGETPVALQGGIPNGTAQPGIVYAPNIVNSGKTVRMLFLVTGVDNNSGAFNGGSSIVSAPAALNTASLTVSGVLTGAASGNPPQGPAYLSVDIDTSGLTSSAGIILEFRLTGSGKATGAVTTTQASAADINAGTALKVGSCYVAIVFQ